MNTLAQSLMDEISLELRSFRQIADKFDVPLSWVYEAWDMLCAKEAELDCDSWFDDKYEQDNF
jgi:hypothetical protein